MLLFTEFLGSPEHLTFPFVQITVVISQVTGVVADMIIFVTMCYSLRRARYPEIVV